jgi:hypothetical protein
MPRMVCGVCGLCGVVGSKMSGVDGWWDNPGVSGMLGVSGVRGGRWSMVLMVEKPAARVSFMLAGEGRVICEVEIRSSVRLVWGRSGDLGGDPLYSPRDGEAVTTALTEALRSITVRGVVGG